MHPLTFKKAVAAARLLTEVRITRKRTSQFVERRFEHLHIIWCLDSFKKFELGIVDNDTDWPTPTNISKDLVRLAWEGLSVGDMLEICDFIALLAISIYVGYRQNVLELLRNPILKSIDFKLVDAVVSEVSLKMMMQVKVSWDGVEVILNDHNFTSPLLSSFASCYNERSYTSALRNAACIGSLPVVNLLLKDGRATEIDDAMVWAADKGQIHIVQRLLEDPRLDFDTKYSPINKAAQNGHVAVLAMLLHDGRYDPSANDNEVLDHSYDDNIEILEMLLKDGRCDPMSKNGQFTFRCAVQESKLLVVETYLKDDRVDPTKMNMEEIEGYTECNHFDMRKLLSRHISMQRHGWGVDFNLMRVNAIMTANNCVRIASTLSLSDISIQVKIMMFIFSPFDLLVTFNQPSKASEIVEKMLFDLLEIRSKRILIQDVQNNTTKI